MDLEVTRVPTDTGCDVVVGWNGTPAAREAVRWAALEAVVRGVRLVVVHAASDAAEWCDPLVITDPSAYAAVVADEGAAIARAEAHSCRAALVVGHRGDLRSAREALLGRSERAGLLVVGSSSTEGAAAREALPAAVASRAWCPVAIVPRDGHRRAGPEQPVVVGVDGSPASRSATRLAALHAARAGAALRVHACWSPPTRGGHGSATHLSTVTEGEVSRGAAWRRAEEVAEGARRAHPGLEVVLEVATEQPGAGLLTASEHAGVLVVGRRGRGPQRDLLLGSTARTLLQRSPCPVIVVPAG